MNHKEIYFYVNNERIGPTEIHGSQPDLGFFEDLKADLRGDCTITFQVGSQRVESRVHLNQTEFKVHNNFVPFDIKEFVGNQKQRVRKEQSAAKFVDHLIEVYYVPAPVLLASKRTLPLFDRSRLVKDPEGRKFFVSHPWQSAGHPDPDGKQLAVLKRHAEQHGKNAFYWIDYSCLPQNPRNTADEEFFNQTLPKISTIQSECATIVLGNEDYRRRMWCYVEEFTGVLFSQIRFGGLSGIEYVGRSPNQDSMLEKTQNLEEPDWGKLQVSRPSDIPGIKFNYYFMVNVAKFQLLDRFLELLGMLPGRQIYSGPHYPQSAFGIDYGPSLTRLRDLFIEFGGDVQYFNKKNSMLWLARRFSWSVFPNRYKVENFRFSPYLFHSAEMVGYVALLLGIIKILNRDNEHVLELRELYVLIVMMSLFS